VCGEWHITSWARPQRMCDMVFGMLVWDAARRQLESAPIAELARQLTIMEAGNGNESIEEHFDRQNKTNCKPQATPAQQKRFITTTLHKINPKNRYHSVAQSLPSITFWRRPTETSHLARCRVKLEEKEQAYRQHQQERHEQVPPHSNPLRSHRGSALRCSNRSVSL